jgi:hypothetical protein
MSQTTLFSLARVATDRPGRYLTQLCKHFANKTRAEWTDDSGCIQFDFGTCRLVAEERSLVLTAEAADEESLARVEQVTASHLVRFATRDELTVDWTRSPA